FRSNNVTVIPNEAIIRTGERNIVFVAKGEGAFEPREVTLGMEGGPRNNDIEILEGVQPGEEIVTSAQFLFDSESRLQEAIQKMLQQKQDSTDMEMNNMDSSGGEMNHDTEPVDTTDHSSMNM